METLDLDRTEADHGNGMEVAASDVATDAGHDTEEQAEAVSLTLIQRLAAIRKACDGVGKEDIEMEYFDKKSGDKRKFTIQGHTIEGVLAGIRPLLDAFGVMCLPNLIERTYNGNRCDIIVEFTWINVDAADDKLTLRWGGADTDNGGKGFAKAGTNAMKEHLKKLFNITAREDAKEEGERLEHMTEEGIKRTAVKQEQERAKAALETWAKAFKFAIEGAKDSKALSQIKRENSLQLSEVPGVTRTFFEGLLAAKKSELESAEADQTDANAKELE